MITIPDMIKNRHQRIRSARGPADIALCYEGECFRCYMADAEKVNDWLAGTGLCEFVDLAEDPLFDDTIAQCSISMVNMEKAVPIIQQHASVALVDPQICNGTLTMLRFLVGNKLPGPVATPKRTLNGFTESEIEQLGDLF